MCIVTEFLLFFAKNFKNIKNIKLFLFDDGEYVGVEIFAVGEI